MGALSKLFQHECGKVRARAILAEAEWPHVNDSRDVWLTAADVRCVVSACEWKVHMYLILMAATGMDTAPMLRIRVRDFDEERWTLYVRDTKKAPRKRTLDLSPVATYCLKLLTDGKPNDAAAFTLTRGQINYRWRRAREVADLTEEGGFPSNVRLKDLRHTFAVHYLRGGGNLAALAGRMGHGRESQSLQYAKHEARGLEDMEQAAHAMGLRLPEQLQRELERPEREESHDEEMPVWWFDRNALPRDPEEGEELQVTQRYQEAWHGWIRRGPQGIQPALARGAETDGQLKGGWTNVFVHRRAYSSGHTNPCVWPRQSP